MNAMFFLLALLTMAAFILISSFRPMLMNVDLGWHLAQGRWMVEHGSFYRQDRMNYLDANQPIVDEYPFFQLVFYLAFCLGWWGPGLLTAILFGILLMVLARSAWMFLPGGSAAFTVALGVAVLYFQLGLLLRPHLISYLCLACAGVFLLRHRHAASWTEFWPLILLQIIWTNSHSAFVIGPAMVAFFGLEVTIRQSMADRKIAWPVARIWAGASLLILLACLVNPFGVSRFYPPFYQAEAQTIRAYVSEMQPLESGSAAIYGNVNLVAGAAVLLAVFTRRGISFSFLFLAGLFYFQALSTLKAWPIFALFLPLLVLSTGAFGPAERPGTRLLWVSGVGIVIVAAIFAKGISFRLTGPSSLPDAWREYDLGHTEVCKLAVAWMKAHGIQGRLLNRCEDGGLLQSEGYDHGETFADTGFGKYTQEQIHIQGVLGERPALLSRYIAAYHPSFVVCGSFCFRWPSYLRAAGWRPIFFSPYDSVWTQPGTRLDRPTLSPAEIGTIFTRDIAAHGQPADPLLYARSLIALNSAGAEEAAFTQMSTLPDDQQRSSWYWETARIVCFEVPRFSPAHRAWLTQLAGRISNPGLTADFRASARYDAGDAVGARQILEGFPFSDLGTHAADLLLRIDLEQNRPQALALAESNSGFELRDGAHWEYVAEAEQRAGHLGAAAKAWRQAFFFFPDDPEITSGAAAFAARNHDQQLARIVAAGPILKSQ